MLHKIQGNDISQPVKHLKVNNNSITDSKEIANTLVNTITYNLIIIRLPFNHIKLFAKEMMFISHWLTTSHIIFQ